MTGKVPLAKTASDGVKEAGSSPKREHATPRSRSAVDQVLHLQRTIGNQAVQRLLEAGGLRAKLRIGRPGDIYEQEADRLADRVTRMTQPPVAEEPRLARSRPLGAHTTPAIQRQTEEHEEEEEILQTQARPSQRPECPYDWAFKVRSLEGRGQPLPQSTRAYFEPRFGHDFGEVRIHTDSRSAEVARGLNARAFTVGPNVVFETGQYVPGTVGGRRLLAHELTHVLQQRGLTRNTPILQRKAKEPKTTIKLGMKAVEYPDGRLEVQIIAPWKEGSGLASTYIAMARVAGIRPQVLADELMSCGVYKSLRHIQRGFLVGTRIVVERGHITAVSVGGKAYKKVPEKKWATVRLPHSLTFYPGRTGDPAEIVMGMNAERLQEKGRTVSEKIESLDDIFTLLDKIAKAYRKHTGARKVGPFLSELVVYGHGEPGWFKFGKKWYEISDFKGLKSGMAKAYLKTNARVKLDGCYVAAGPEGERFLCEVGRVFFGSKSGRVWGNTKLKVPGAGAHGPKEIMWPTHCRAKLNP